MLTSMGIMLIPVITTVIALLLGKLFSYTNKKTCHNSGNGLFSVIWVIGGVAIAIMTAGMWWFYLCVALGEFAFTWIPLCWWIYTTVISLLLHGVFYCFANRS